METPTLEVGLNRILRLADFIETVPESSFNFTHWADSRTYNGELNSECGTTACALGWATTMPMFKKLGLRLVYERGSASAKVGIRMGCFINLIDIFHKLFGLGYDVAVALFLPFHGYKDICEIHGELATPKAWAARARKIVALVAKENGLELHTVSTCGK